MFKGISSRAAELSAPIVVHHVGGSIPADYPLLIETRATKEISCKVMIAIRKTPSGLFTTKAVVQYQNGDKWYEKQGNSYMDARDALKGAYSLARGLYKVTASRALAGLLHDGVVPATEDIEF